MMSRLLLAIVLIPVILDNNWPALAAKFQHVPSPCYFTPSAGSDGEAVLLDHGVFDGQERTYEFW